MADLVLLDIGGNTWCAMLFGRMMAKWLDRPYAQLPPEREKPTRRRSNSWNGDVRWDRVAEQYEVREQPLQPLPIPCESKPEKQVTSAQKGRFGFDLHPVLPILIAQSGGLLLKVCGVTCPGVVSAQLDYFGSAFTPMLFVLLGISMELGQLRHPEIRRKVVRAVRLRLFLSTLLSLALAAALHSIGQGDTAKVWALGFFSPVTVLAVLHATELGYDASLTALAQTATCIASFPLMWLIVVVFF
jgi:predicted permease